MSLAARSSRTALAIGGYDPVMVALCVLMVVVLLIILWHCVLLPGIERMHRRFHREMEDER